MVSIDYFSPYKSIGIDLEWVFFSLASSGFFMAFTEIIYFQLSFHVLSVNFFFRSRFLGRSSF